MTKDIAARTAGNLYAEVTDRIIAELEEGRLPWIQAWDGSKLESGLPSNAGTGRRYSGINVLILWAKLFERGFEPRRVCRRLQLLRRCSPYEQDDEQICA